MLIKNVSLYDTLTQKNRKIVLDSPAPGSMIQDIDLSSILIFPFYIFAKIKYSHHLYISALDIAIITVVAVPQVMIGRLRVQ
jgi:hypothetical protein